MTEKKQSKPDYKFYLLISSISILIIVFVFFVVRNTFFKVKVNVIPKLNSPLPKSSEISNELPEKESSPILMEKTVLDCIKKAREYLKRGETSKALTFFSKAIELSPNSPDTYNERALAYMRNGELEKALNDLDHVLKIDPQIIEAYLNKAIVYLKLKDYEKGIDAATVGIGKTSQGIDLARLYCQRGLLNAYKGNYKKAIRDYDESIRYYPKLPHPYFNKGILLEIMGRKRDAYILFKKTAELTKNKKDLKQLFKKSSEEEHITTIMYREAVKRAKRIEMKSYN